MSDQGSKQLIWGFDHEPKPVTEAQKNSARFSPCGRYRYTLTRELGGDRPAVICGLNPSKAGADDDDPTIRKDCGFARRWKCGRLLKVNADAYVATFPKDLLHAWKSGLDVTGPENDEVIRQAIGLALLADGLLVVAWGRHLRSERQAAIWELIQPSGITPLCLGTNQDGSPKHESRIAYATALVPWSPPA